MGSVVSTLSHLFSYQGSAPPSGLLPGEGQEVRGVGKFSLDICDLTRLLSGSWGSFTHSWSNSSVLPLEGHCFHPTQNTTTPHSHPYFLPHGESLCGQVGIFSTSVPTCHLFHCFLFPVLDEAALLPWSWFSLSPLLCTTNPPKTSLHSRFTWHGKCQDLETQSPFFG